MAGRPPAEADALALWFNPPGEANTSRRVLTRERVVAEGLTVIAAVGAQALSMRALATRLGVVPGALYRHVRNKEQLYDLILDAVLAEVDCQVDAGQPWTTQIAALAHRLRSVLEDRPGVAALLKIRDPLSPASLALAEAFLAPLLAAGLPGPEAAAAFRLIYDYTLGFAVADPTSPAEQRLRDAATREQLQAFLRALPASRFPALAAHGIHAWSADRDRRFGSGLDILLRGLEAVQRPGVTRLALPPAAAAP
jgi:TetR/AcrR family transcriptional regulator, tetracycline repressor protein